MPVILCMPDLPQKLQVLETYATFISLAMGSPGDASVIVKNKME